HFRNGHPGRSVGGGIRHALDERPATPAQPLVQCAGVRAGHAQPLLPVPAGQRPGVRPPGQRRLAAAVAALADTRGAAMSFPVWNLASVMSAIPAQMKVLLGASLAVML